MYLVFFTHHGQVNVACVELHVDLLVDECLALLVEVLANVGGHDDKRIELRRSLRRESEREKAVESNRSRCCRAGEERHASSGESRLEVGFYITTECPSTKVSPRLKSRWTIK